MPAIKAKTTVLLTPLLLLYACGTQMRVPANTIQSVPPGFKGIFADTVFRMHERNSRHILSSSLAAHFGLKKTDSVMLQFLPDDSLRIVAKKGMDEKQLVVKGIYSPKGYFEIYFSKKNIQIPPLISFLYSSRHIDRLRIALTPEQHLIVDHRWARDGNILLFGGGSSCRGQYYYKKGV